MNIVSPELHQMNDEYLNQISDLNMSLFEGSKPLRFEDRPNLLFTLAEVEGKIVAFKAGYDRKPDHFYSWLGGVAEPFRGLEIRHGAETVAHSMLQSACSTKSLLQREFDYDH